MEIGPSTELALRTTATDAEPRAAQAPEGAGAGPDFSSILADGITRANELHAEGAAKTAAVAAGKSDDLHGTMISVKEAEIAMKLVGSVRNRLLDAFHELWRINL